MSAKKAVKEKYSSIESATRKKNERKNKRRTLGISTGGGKRPAAYLARYIPCVSGEDN